MNHVEKTPGFESQKISWEAGEKTYTKNSKEPVKHYNFLPMIHHHYFDVLWTLSKTQMMITHILVLSRQNNFQIFKTYSFSRHFSQHKTRFQHGDLKMHSC